MARQDYFTHFEPSQSLGGVKTGDPRENTTEDIPQADFACLTVMWRELGSNPRGHEMSELFRALKISP